MIVYINESKLPLLRESNEEVTFYEFFTKTKNFIKDLLSDPINAKPDNMFKAHGISKSTLLNKLLDRGIVTKKEDIKEPNDADGKMKSMHYIQYKVPKKNFEQKIKRLYQYFYDNFKKNEINESILDNVRPQKYNSAATYIFCKDKSGMTYVLAGKRRGNHEGGKYNVPTGQVGDKYYDLTDELGWYEYKDAETGAGNNHSSCVESFMVENNEIYVRVRKYSQVNPYISGGYDYFNASGDAIFRNTHKVMDLGDKLIRSYVIIPQK